MVSLLKYPLKLIGSSILLMNLINQNPIEANDCFESFKNEVVIWSIDKIKTSEMADINTFNCEVVDEMNKMNPEQISITSGRKQRKPVICLSDESDYPCKFVIGFINPQFDAATALSEIYSFTPPKSSQLNETVERLFLKPSSLIQ
tara:strand:- start:229 stop:666 length:438 start_codon:yes stop_codon:yes gene_type:complete